MQKITPFLWFDTQAEEAAHFYTSIFPNSKINNITRFGSSGPGPEGSVMTIGFELNGLKFIALNGGPHYQFNNAISFMVDCDSQEEIDHYWSKLTEGGQEIQCGWLNDRFGVAWQIVPKVFFELIKDEEKSQRVMQALYAMKKIDIQKLRDAANNLS